MKKKTKQLFPKLIAICLAIIALALAFILTGAQFFQEGILVNTEGKVKLFGLIFGGSTIYGSIGNVEMNVEYTGGISYLGIASFILLTLGILIIVFALLKGKTKIDLLGYLLLLVGGVLMFFALKVGSEVEASGITQEFAEFFKDYTVSIGVYVYSALSILGSVIGFSNYLLK